TIKLKVDQILTHQKLPNHRSNRRIVVSLYDQPEPVKYEFYIQEIFTYRNVYYSLKDMYLQFGNMLLSFRKLLKNSFLIGFVSFGANFDDFIKPVLEEIKRLEHGLIMQTIYGNAWIIGGISCIMADLSQGNDLYYRLSSN
ncbi:1388_t:CDS:2, partial [Funneliformis geosporum]